MMLLCLADGLLLRHWLHPGTAKPARCHLPAHDKKNLGSLIYLEALTALLYASVTYLEDCCLSSLLKMQPAGW